ncbi:four-carbon acid sugar kinase family protein [Cellulomonas endophytica]|uniref:four-carbon acid sugar kinase family protein n=1 Tax=Cellulomonas endophytica TaxID=2494735 RepID=UPI0010126FBD|nr:four-carbon acid sugar kinase family protein [Cellulomonas endophytica]
MSGPGVLGVVADDLTGACDLAEAVVAAGLPAVVVVGVPAPDLPLPLDPAGPGAVVVALRTRTAPAAGAVRDSRAAARWLLAGGARTLYQKYCSTFDSTDEGTIGPVADGLRDLLDTGGAAPAVGVGTPATPRVGRTQYLGHLFVGGRLLSRSPMRDHPLTPMREPDLLEVLGRQTAAPVALVPWPTVAAGPDAVARAVAAAAGAGARHVLADALREEDLDVLAAAVGRPGLPPLLLTGAAGLAGALARAWGDADRRAADRPEGRTAGPGPGAATATTATTAPTSTATRTADRTADLPAVPAGRALVVAGSCSATTRRQVAAFRGPVVPLDPRALAADGPGPTDGPTDGAAGDASGGGPADGPALRAVLAAVGRALEGAEGPVLVASSAAPDRVAAVQAELGAGRVAALLEAAAGRVAAVAVERHGVRRLLVAGGETSGAVAAALGVRVLHVGPAAAPGLPWTVPADGPRVALLLKSGGFGEHDLFTTAWATAP